jgi:hypothetical protein
MEGQATLEQRMLNDTLGAFGEGNATPLTAERGTLLLEGWLNALRGDVGAERILAEIGTLRDLLKEPNPDGDQIRHLLLSMASHTAALSHEPTIDPAVERQLKQLVTVLRNVSSQL